ncbi:Lamin-B receptor [Seminavis robusta]|uniref:Lamin-B receptor n=1 Tax=Seminavis robusta TaxID=568900 RepID=A0A9N8E776_9STRA|nr:Lamin-B receptor [Seminavis robusta]|eukprot:Sro623_g177080.1 Lamin-B receptor (459) ;mRNA; r:7816-9192
MTSTNDNDDDWLVCFVFVVILYSVIAVVHILCPARIVKGYACNPLSIKDENPQPLEYCLNGFRCFWIVVGGFLALHYVLPNKIITLFLQKNYFGCAMASNGLGLLVSFYFVYIRFPYSLSLQEQAANDIRRAPTIVALQTTNVPIQQQGNTLDERGFHFFNGRELNPRFHLAWVDNCWPLKNDNLKPKIDSCHNHTIFDVKMFLYIVGALVLELNILSGVWCEQELRGDNTNSNGMLLYTALFTWFILDYMWYEEIHLYTYDLFAEKVGFKLIWGCFCFYPFVYPIGVLPFLMAPTAESAWSFPAMALITLIYIAGSVMTRGANLQKYYFRRNPHQRQVALFGGLLVLPQETVPSSNNRLLCSGFWGLSRHVNYIGEILQAVALALPGWWHIVTAAENDTGNNATVLMWLPWLYPLYYVALFIPRQLEDEHMMRRKYGDKVMDDYCARVPYRMLPGVY